MLLYSFVKEYAGTKSKSASSVNLFRNIVLKPKCFIFDILCDVELLLEFDSMRIQLPMFYYIRRLQAVHFEYARSNKIQVNTLGFMYPDTDTWQRIQ